MSARFVGLCIQAMDPRTMARFWAEALRWETDDRPGDELRLLPTDGTTFGIVFEQVSERGSERSTVHLDLATTSLEDQRETVATLLELGARRIDIGQGPDAPHVVLADPEGNELCVFEPEATGPGGWYVGCPRLAAVNCVGSAEDGRFWSAALGWPLVWDQDDETAVRDAAGAFVTWSPAPDPNEDRVHRHHLHVAPRDEEDVAHEIDTLLALGATLLDSGQRDDRGSAVLADRDGYPFCLLSS